MDSIRAVMKGTNISDCTVVAWRRQGWNIPCGHGGFFTQEKQAAQHNSRAKFP